MSNKQTQAQVQESEIEELACRFLAGLYYNPQHVARCEAERPIMPDRPTTKLWDSMQEASDEGGLDTARLAALVKADRETKGLLDSIKSGDVLRDVEAARYGFRGQELERLARRLNEYGGKLQLATRLGALAQRIPETTASLDDVSTGVISETLAIVNKTRGTSMRHISDFTKEALGDVKLWEQGEDPDRLPTGFVSLDNKIGGLPLGELTIFASMSGMGKTSWIVALIAQVARIIEKTGKAQAVVLFSIEMSGKQIVHRAASQLAESSLHRLRMGSSASRPGGRLVREVHAEAIKTLSKLPIFIDPDPRPSLDQIYSRCLQVGAEHDVVLVGIDYDEKVDVEGEGNEEKRIARIAEGSKIIAKRLHAAVVALSQYNSYPASQMRPGTDDELRGSRKKKHEASTILHWYWPHYWIQKGDVDLSSAQVKDLPERYRPDTPELGWLRVTKGREGPTTTIPLRFYPEHTRFEDPKDPEVRERRKKRQKEQEGDGLAEEYPNPNGQQANSEEALPF